MKKGFKLFSMAVCACAVAACSDDDTTSTNPAPTWGGEDATEQYIVMSGSGESGVYLQQVTDPTQGILDATSTDNNRQFVSAANYDPINYNNKYLIGMVYPSQGGATADDVTICWKLENGKMTKHGAGVALMGDVKARGFYKNYLIGTSTQGSETDGHYEKVKFVDLNTFGNAYTDGIYRCDEMDKEPFKTIGECVGFTDIAEYGDYLLISYSTKTRYLDGNMSRAKASFPTKLANNLYLGVYEFTPNEKPYLKFKHLISRKSEDHPGYEAGHIQGNLRSRTETGIEVVGNDIYLFCQGYAKNQGETVPQTPSAVLRISGSNIENGMPKAIDDDSQYYVNLTQLSGGYYLWRCYNLGNDKFCLQMFTEKGGEGTSGSHYRFGIFDIKAKTYTAVEGMPDPSLINDIALLNAIDTEKHTATFEVELNNSQKPALYTISADGKATRGLEVNTEAIQGVTLLKN